MTRAQAIAMDCLIWLTLGTLFVGYCIAWVIGTVGTFLCEKAEEAVDWVKEQRND